jgi:hypothetical protein
VKPWQFRPPLAFGGHTFVRLGQHNEIEDYGDDLSYCLLCGEFAPYDEVSIHDDGWQALLSRWCPHYGPHKRVIPRRD